MLYIRADFVSFLKKHLVIGQFFRSRFWLVEIAHWRFVKSGWLFHKVKQWRSRLVAGWVTAVLDFVEDPTNAEALHGILVCVFLLFLLFFVVVFVVVVVVIVFVVFFYRFWEIPSSSLSSFNSTALRKHAYLNILKFLPPKTENFQMKNSDNFHISAQNIDCGTRSNCLADLCFEQK